MADLRLAVVAAESWPRSAGLWRLGNRLKAEQQTRTKAALELEVELDNGRIMVVVQEEDDVFVVGDRVRVIVDSRGVTRVRQ